MENKMKLLRHYPQRMLFLLFQIGKKAKRLSFNSFKALLQKLYFPQFMQKIIVLFS